MLKIQKQASKLVKVYFTILSSIQRRMENNFILNAICRLMHIISIIGYLALMALDIVPSFTHSETAIQVLVSVRSLFVVPSIIIFIAFSTVFSLQWIFFNQYGTLQDHKQIIKVNRIIGFIIYYFLEVTYFPACFIFLNCFSKLESLKNLDYCSIIIGCILLLSQTVLLNLNRIYGNYALLIPILLVFLNPYVGLASVFGVTIVTLYRDNTSSEENKCNNIMYFAITVTCFWSYLQLNVHDKDILPVTACINLAIIIIGSIGTYLIIPINFNGSQLTTNKKLFKIFQKQSKSQTHNSEQFHRVDIFEEMGFQKYIQDMQKSQQICLPKKITDTASYQWQQQKKKQLLWQKIKMGKCNDNSFQSFLFYFRSGLSLKIEVLKLLKQLANYLHRTQQFNLNQRYRIYRLVQQINQNYEEANGNSDGYMHISDVIEIEKNYFNYYLQIDQLLFQLVQFWKEMMVSQFTVTNQVEEKMEMITQLEKKAVFSINKLKHHRIRQQQKLYDMIHSITNGYQPIKEYNDVIKLQKSSSFEYIILQSDQINKISLRLIKSLGYEPDSINTHMIRSFLPSGFSYYLQEIQQIYLQQNQQSHFILPVINSTGCIQVKKCLLYLVPKLDSSLQYLMTFQNLQTAAKIFFLYNVSKQKIEIFSESFKNFIGMKQESFTEFLNNESVLFPNDVFQTDLESQQLNLLRSHQVLKTKIIYSNFYLLKNNLYNYNDEVSLHLEHEFTFSGHSYLLINVLSESYRQAKIDEQSRSQTNVTVNVKQKQLYNEYVNQQFFCKIENPYKSKIIEKLSNIKTRSCKSYFYRVFIINLAIFFLIICNIISFKVLSSSLIVKGLDISNIMLNFNNQYLFLLRLYSNTFSNQFFNMNVNDISAYINRQFLGSNGTTSQLSTAILELKEFYQKFNIYHSKQLMSTYLLYKQGIQNHPFMDYTVTFDQFAIETSTKLTSFYDFIVQVEQGYSDGTAIDFLLVNYDQIVKILPIYEKEEAFFEDFASSLDLVMLVGYLFISFLTLLLAASFIIILKMVKTHEKIYSLYQFIDRGDAKKIIKQLTKIKQSIGEISIKGDDRMRNQIYSSLMAQNITHNSKRAIKLQQGEQLEKQSNQKKPNTLMKAFKLLFFYPLALGIAWFIIHLQYNSIDSNSNDFKEIIQLLQKIQQDQIILQKIYSDIFYSPFYKIRFQQEANISRSAIVKNQFFSKNLPGVFLEDFKYEENICLTDYTLDRIPYFSISVAECEKMQLGVLTKGYSQALQFYSTYLRQQALIPLDQYLKEGIYSDKNKLKEIIFLKQILMNYLRIKKVGLTDHYGDYIAEVNQQKIEVMILTIIGGLVFLTLLIYKIFLLKKTMNIVIGLLCIIPTAAMYKMNTTNYIRKNGILDQIDKI